MAATSTGPAEQAVLRLGRRASAVVQASVAVLFGAAGLVAAPPENWAVAAAAVLLLVVWNIGAVVRDAGRSVVANAALVAAVCLTQRWTAPAQDVLYDDRVNWVLAVASAALAGYQWHTTRRAGVSATVVVIVAYLGGAAAAGTTSWVGPVLTALWLAVEAGLSRGLFRLVRDGARVADRMTAENLDTRRRAVVAAARREDEREQLAALHDTAAATMLAIGLGTVTGREPWFTAQLDRDLAVLAGGVDPPAGPVDLLGMLEAVAAQSPVDIEFSGTALPPVPAMPAAAICRSVGEALANVARHSGVCQARLVVSRAGDGVGVELVDTGRGFDPHRIPRNRRGIELSIMDRMNRVGGQATVIARPLGGTLVRLEWNGE